MTIPKLPDGDNVYGVVVAPNGLDRVLRAVNRIVGVRRATIYESHFNGAETLRFSTTAADFESTPLEDGRQHLLNGGVGGSAEDALAFVREMSRLFTEAQIEFSFEVYDDDRHLVRTYQNGVAIGPNSDKRTST